MVNRYCIEPTESAFQPDHDAEEPLRGKLSSEVPARPPSLVDIGIKSH